MQITLQPTSTSFQQQDIQNVQELPNTRYTYKPLVSPTQFNPIKKSKLSKNNKQPNSTNASRYKDHQQSIQLEPLMPWCDQDIQNYQLLKPAPVSLAPASGRVVSTVQSPVVKQSRVSTNPTPRQSETVSLDQPTVDNNSIQQSDLAYNYLKEQKVKAALACLPRYSSIEHGQRGRPRKEWKPDNRMAESGRAAEGSIQKFFTHTTKQQEKFDSSWKKLARLPHSPFHSSKVSRLEAICSEERPFNDSRDRVDRRNQQPFFKTRRTKNEYQMNMRRRFMLSTHSQMLLENVPSRHIYSSHNKFSQLSDQSSSEEKVKFFVGFIKTKSRLMKDLGHQFQRVLEVSGTHLRVSQKLITKSNILGPSNKNARLSGGQETAGASKEKLMKRLFRKATENKTSI